MNIYAVHGVPPEEIAYAMARFSRSPDGFADSLRWIRDQKKSAGDFLNTYYFQYGHASIADLAHSVVALEGVSHLQAFHLWQEPLFDGQEQSTRYQDFSKAKAHNPWMEGYEAHGQYEKVVKAHLDAYQVVKENMVGLIRERCPIPEDMTTAAYNRTVDARAFDYARAFLPLGLETNMGLIGSGRTFERTLSRLRTTAEMHGLDALDTVAHEIQQALAEPSMGDDLERSQSASLPTLTKYTDASRYEIELRLWLQVRHDELFGKVAVTDGRRHDDPLVTRVQVDDVEVEIAATLLWTTGFLPFGRYVETCRKNPTLVKEIIHKASKLRGKHDPYPREFRAGQKFIFEINLDVGAARDLNRHRRGVTLYQPITNDYGRSKPGPLVAADPMIHGAWMNTIHGLKETTYRFKGAHGAGGGLLMDGAMAHLKTFDSVQPMLMKMDYEQFCYVTELRSGVKGHFAYREAAWQMYLQGKNETIADLRVTPPWEDDLLTR